MFVTLPEFEFHVPAPLNPVPSSRHWRVMSLQHFGAWHILAMRVGQGRDAHVASIIFARDHDLLAALQDPQASEIVSLTSMVSSQGRWLAVSIREVWLGQDLAQSGEECIVLVDSQDHCRTGFLGEINPKVKADRLVARVGARRTCPIDGHRGLQHE